MAERLNSSAESVLATAVPMAALSPASEAWRTVDLRALVYDDRCPQISDDIRHPQSKESLSVSPNLPAPLCAECVLLRLQLENAPARTIGSLITQQLPEFPCKSLVVTPKWCDDCSLFESLDSLTREM